MQNVTVLFQFIGPTLSHRTLKLQVVFWLVNCTTYFCT